MWRLTREIEVGRSPRLPPNLCRGERYAGWHVLSVPM